MPYDLNYMFVYMLCYVDAILCTHVNKSVYRVQQSGLEIQAAYTTTMHPDRAPKKGKVPCLTLISVSSCLSIVTPA